MDLQEVGWGACIRLIWLRRGAVLNAEMNLRVPNNAENFLTS